MLVAIVGSYVGLLHCEPPIVSNHLINFNFLHILVEKMTTKKKDSYNNAKKRVPFLQGDSVFAQMFRMIFFGADKQK